MSLLPIPVNPDAAATFARILLAVLFLAHGVPKMKNIKGTVAFVRGTGFPGGAVFAVLFTLLEFFGQILAILFALQMVATSIFAKTKLGKKFTGGYELDALFLVLAITVALLGPGPWSLDRVLGLA